MFFRKGFTYILANRKQGVLYIGLTSNLKRRIWQHKHGIKSGFPSRYNVNKLVYYECYDGIVEAREREWQLKRWRRSKKIYLIELRNPEWRDLWNEL